MQFMKMRSIFKITLSGVFGYGIGIGIGMVWYCIGIGIGMHIIANAYHCGMQWY